VRSLRLLDLVSQSTAAAPTLPEGWAFPGAHHFADAVRSCPLRLVLADDLTQCTTQLAYAEGARLSGCLDLIHVPSQQLWLEWVEATRQSTLREIPSCADACCSGITSTDRSSVRRTGVLIAADQAGRAGTMRTFWSTATEQVYSAALLTEFDLDHVMRPALDVDAVFSGTAFGVVMPVEAALDELLSHVCFRLDPAWASYYRGANLTENEQLLVLREVLGTMAFDMPMILALFLLFLEHIEVRAPIDVGYQSAAPPSGSANQRRGPRLHHVRGHIARRGDKVFWRLPHLRGSAHRGVVRSRTVQLSFH